MRCLLDVAAMFRLILPRDTLSNALVNNHKRFQNDLEGGGPPLKPLKIVNSKFT